jgi:ankyrin repeat protein
LSDDFVLANVLNDLYHSLTHLKTTAIEIQGIKIKKKNETVNILLKCNSSVNLCDTDGYTPLHVACIHGNIDIVNILLKCNSSVNLCGTDGYTPLMTF